MPASTVRTIRIDLVPYVLHSDLLIIWWMPFAALQCLSGTYAVEDEFHKVHTVSRENLKVDSLTAPAL